MIFLRIFILFTNMTSKAQQQNRSHTTPFLIVCLHIGEFYYNYISNKTVVNLLTRY
ncbi:hypothetical protein C0J52_12905, partial [Blattella germanica]